MKKFFLLALLVCSFRPAFSQCSPDNTPPVITCPGVDTLYLGASCTVTLPNYDTIIPVVDACDPSPTIWQSPSVGTSLSGPSSITVQLFARDASFNSSTCTFTVTAQDSTPPTMVCNALTLQLSGAGIASLTPSDIDGGTTDNCTASPTLSASKTSFTCTDLGSNTVQLYGEDAYGNLDSCSAAVTVADTIIPAIVGCPSPISISVDSTTCDTSISWSLPTVNDNCGTHLIATHTIPYLFSPGTETVMYVANDSAGNLDTCSFTVTVTPPAFSIKLRQDTLANGYSVRCHGDCSGSAWVEIQGGCAPYSVNWSTGVSTDSIVGLCAADYSVTVTDDNGGSASDSILITEPPVSLLASFGCDSTATPTIVFGDSSTGSPTNWWWTFGDGGVDSVANPTHKYDSTGTYPVTMIVEDSCGSDTVTKMLFVDVPVGLVSADAYAGRIHLVPNPAQHTVRIQFKAVLAKESSVEIWSVSGQQVEALETGPLNGNTSFHVNLEGLSSGLYFVRFEIENELVIRKLLVK